MKSLAVIFIISLISINILSAQPVAVSENKRYLVDKNGDPFFWLGDTAWELFHRLNREEATMYLEDRAAKGFNVVQAVVLAELDGLNVPNPYGHTPLQDNDPTKPIEAYFEHVDFIVKEAEALGITIGMLPTWGDKWLIKWGKGPVIFNEDNAEVYGKYIGARYKDQANIVWILGGDRNPEKESDYAITRAMAKGIKAGDEGKHLITFHPQGGASSSDYFHEDDWLNFNLFQSGHGATDFPNYEMATADYEKTPIKPVLDGEPRYENIPIGFNIKNGRHLDFSVRKAAYFSLLSGSCGHTYGNNNIWQMWAPGRGAVIKARTPWYDAIHHSGATQMGYARKLLESRAFHLLKSAQEMLAYPKNNKNIRIALNPTKSALIYLPEGQAVKINLKELDVEKITAWWFDPREGTAEKIGNFEISENKIFDFIPPSQGIFNDWVLVLDNAEAGYDEPGK